MPGHNNEVWESIDEGGTVNIPQGEEERTIREGGLGLRNSLAEKAEASVAAAKIDRVYLRSGLAGIEGLEIDGAAATTQSLFEAGPEDLTREILDTIKAEWGLSEQERKN